MSAHSRRKGARIEREVVQLLRGAGIPAERVPLSGAAGGSFTGDVVIAHRWRAEVKARGAGAGFKVLERWLGEADLLVLRRDRAEPMVVLPWPLARALLVLATVMGSSSTNGAGKAGGGDSA